MEANALFRTLVLCIAIRCVPGKQSTNAPPTTPEPNTPGLWDTKIAVVIESNLTERDNERYDVRSFVTLNYDRLEKAFDALLNYTIYQDNIVPNQNGDRIFWIRMMIYLASRENRTDNMAYLRDLSYTYMHRYSDGRLLAMPSGSQLVTDVKKKFTYHPLTVWRTVDESVRQGNGQYSLSIGDWEAGPRGELMVWIATQDTTKYEPREVYDQMVNRFGFKSVGLTDEELARTMEKIQGSESFAKWGLLLEK